MPKRIHKLSDAGGWRPVWFKSLVSVKRWATRYKHTWHMEGKVVIVSEADGTIHRYAEGVPAGATQERSP